MKERSPLGNLARAAAIAGSLGPSTPLEAHAAESKAPSLRIEVAQKESLQHSYQRSLPALREKIQDIEALLEEARELSVGAQEKLVAQRGQLEQALARLSDIPSDVKISEIAAQETALRDELHHIARLLEAKRHPEALEKDRARLEVLAAEHRAVLAALEQMTPAAQETPDADLQARIAKLEQTKREVEAFIEAYETKQGLLRLHSKRMHDATLSEDMKKMPAMQWRHSKSSLRKWAALTHTIRSVICCP